MENKYPELEKRKAVAPISQEIGKFLDWLYDRKEYRIAEYDGDELWSIGRDFSSLLHEYFGIDQNKIEEELRQLLDEQRELNEK